MCQTDPRLLPQLKRLGTWRSERDCEASVVHRAKSGRNSDHRAILAHWQADITVLVAPVRRTTVYLEIRKGDWTETGCSANSIGRRLSNPFSRVAGRLVVVWWILCVGVAK